MTVAVVQFGGSNCDRDAVAALSHLGIDAERVWHADGLPDDCTGVILPGGFSYGDYLRAGAMAARSPVMAEVREVAEEGTPVLGVCNGAQIGCESGLTEGAFTTNRSARFQCERVRVRVENAETPWTRAYDEGEVIELPIAHGEGRFEIGGAQSDPGSRTQSGDIAEGTSASSQNSESSGDRGASETSRATCRSGDREELGSSRSRASTGDDERHDRLERQDRILFRYCDETGVTTEAANPNGSTGNVAGVLGARETIAVLMPHPERATLPDLGPTDGQGILRGFETDR